MSQDYLARIAALEDALRQKDSQLSLVAETESFLRSALARAEEKIENEEREIEHLRAQIEKLRRMLFGTRSEKLRRQVEEAEALLKQQEQQSDRYNGRDNDQQVPRQLRQSRHRRPLPDHLPREINRLERNLLSGLRQRYGIPQRSQRRAAGAGLQRPESDPHGQGEKGLHPMRLHR
jgi:transposase